MVRLHHLLISACVLQAASARAIRQQVPRRVGIPPTVADTEHAEALGVRRRQNAAEAGAGAGFCRKRVVKVDNSGSPNSTASVGEQKAPVSNSACIPGDVNCLPTITIGAAASTSYIDVTSTILVPAAPTSVSALVKVDSISETSSLGLRLVELR